jgi:hypothetical protein
MRVRAQDASGDYTFGQSEANFLINSSDCVAQLVLTRLKLWEGEWSLDTTEGTPWYQQVLGAGTKPFYDIAIQNRILSTQGVVSINTYSSSVDPTTRQLSIDANISTQFGSDVVQLTLNIPAALR